MKSFLPSALPLLLLPTFVFAQTTHFQTATPAVPATVKSTSAAAKAVLAADYGKLPLSFEANQGQTDSHVKFLSRGNGYALFLTDKAAVLELTKSDQPKADKSKSAARAGSADAAKELAKSRKTDVIRMELAGASQSAQVTGAEQLPGTANYFVGNDASKWHTNVPTYAKVKYAGVYPGVDLIYYGNQSQLEYDFVVAPKADPKAVQLHFAGAEKLKLAANGDLIVAAKDGEIAFHKPVVYQVKNGQKTTEEREAVEGGFALLADNTVGFSLGRYDKSRELVIDPTLAYSTYLVNESRGERIAVDAGGNAYIAGSSYEYPPGSNFYGTPTYYGMVVKFNPSGTALVYSDFFGGGFSTGIALDPAGDAYVTGYAYDSTFPVTAGVVQPTNHAEASRNANSFVLKLNPAGTALLYSTFLGGSGSSNRSRGDYGSAVAVDASGNAYVSGYAYSRDFPVTDGAFQMTNKAEANNEANGFVAKLNPGATALVYSTYLGGSGTPYQSGDTAGPLAVDSSGNAYVAGSTTSLDFPVTEGVIQTTSPGVPQTNLPEGAGFITKLNPTGSGLVYSTYLGPSDTSVNGLALDSSGDVYVTGAAAAGFPVTSNAFQKTPPVPAQDLASGGAFVAKLNPEASALLYSTYLGGSYYDGTYPYDAENPDTGYDIAVDSSGDAYVTGYAVSVGFPVTGDAYEPVAFGGAAFLTKLNPFGSALLYSTLLGGNPIDGDSASGIALDPSGSAYLVGNTHSKGFPTTPGAFQRTAPSGSYGSFVGSAVVAKVSFAASGLVPTATVLTSSANPLVLDQPLTFTAAVTAATGSGTPTGTVTFVLPTGTNIKVAVDGTGHAALHLHAPNAEVNAYSTYEVGAVYSGDSTYALSSNSLVQTIVAPPPVFSIASGTSSPTPLVVYLSDPVVTAYRNGGILYTTDGSDPSNSSTSLLYTGPILAATTKTFRAYASVFVTGGMRIGSAVASATYTITAVPNLIQFQQGFSAPAGLTLGGGAGVVPPALDLVQRDMNSAAGSAYYQTPLPIRSFTTDFTFQLTDPTAAAAVLADGFTFVVQNAGPSPVSTDNNGGGLAYAGIPKSVAIKFDLHDNAGEGPNSTGLYIDGATPTVPAVNLSGTGINLHSGDLFAVHITYDGATLILTITDPKTTASYSHAFAVDIPGTVGGAMAYVGFTGFFSNVTPSILSWTYVPGPPNFPNGFGPGTLGLIENGNAKVTGAALELTDGGEFETASAFYSTPTNIRSFTTNFDFRQSGAYVDTPPYLADGLTFTIQNAGTTALGSKGGGLGYAGIGKSVAIKFDLHDNAGEGDNSTGIYIDGAAPTVPAIDLNRNSGINLQNGHIFNANLIYDGTNLALTITDTVTKRAFTHSFPIDIPATVGGNTAYVGFTGATAALSSTQEMLTWTFTNP